jgi:TonB family protein
MKSSTLFFLIGCFLFSGMKAQAVQSAESTAVPADSMLNLVLDRAEVMPEFPGGTNELMRFISNHLVYPTNARDAGFEGKVIVKFYVDKDGSVKEPIVLRNDGCSECSDEVLRVVGTFPKWSPGLSKGNPVKVYFQLPITLSLGDSGTDVNNKMPIYKGDMTEFENELLEGIRVLYKKNKEKHSMNIVFTVSETGDVNNVSIENSEKIEQQQLDKIKKQVEVSKWYPAVKNGKVVATSHSINLNY